MTTPSADPAGPGLIEPAPDAFVLPFARLRPGFDPAKLPRFGDLAWPLALMSGKESHRSLVVDWSRCPAARAAADVDARGVRRTERADSGRPAPAAGFALGDPAGQPAPLLPDLDPIRDLAHHPRHHRTRPGHS
ncbi:hypothetical protein ACFC09_32555 [Streptomyces sp. NPDC056161]|uniref:hypothetical protein n=1 Tax=Streptomyces sp. NPDC056161 TaxID=3345732 RepID=UPI0035DCB05C